MFSATDGKFLLQSQTNNFQSASTLSRLVLKYRLLVELVSTTHNSNKSTTEKVVLLQSLVTGNTKSGYGVSGDTNECALQRQRENSSKCRKIVISFLQKLSNFRPTLA